MSRLAPVPARSVRRATGPVIRAAARFLWAARRMGLDAVTGQVGTLVRAATGTAVDSTGTTYTVGHSMPRWESRTWSGGAAALGLRLDADDLTWPCAWSPERGSLVVELSEAGTRTTSGAGLAYVGRNDQTGARLILDSAGTNYRATIHNGTSSASVTLATGTPSTGQPVRLTVDLEDVGGFHLVRLTVTDMATGVSTSTAWSSEIARTTAWGTGALLRLNRVGSAGTQGSTWVRLVSWSAVAQHVSPPVFTLTLEDDTDLLLEDGSPFLLE